MVCCHLSRTVIRSCSGEQQAAVFGKQRKQRDLSISAIKKSARVPSQATWVSDEYDECLFYHCFSPIKSIGNAFITKRLLELECHPRLKTTREPTAISCIALFFFEKGMVKNEIIPKKSLTTILT